MSVSLDILRGMLTSLGEASAIIDEKYTIIEANHLFVEMFAGEKAPPVGTHCYELCRARIEPCGADGVPCCVDLALQIGHPICVENATTGPQRKRKHVQIRAVPLGQSKIVVLCLREMSKRDVLLSGLSSRIPGIAIFLKNMDTGVIALDGDDRITAVDDLAAAVLDVDKENLVGAEIAALFGSGGKPWLQTLRQQSQSAGEMEFWTEINLEISPKCKVKVHLRSVDDDGEQILIRAGDCTHPGERAFANVLQLLSKILDMPGAEALALDTVNPGPAVSRSATGVYDQYTEEVIGQLRLDELLQSETKFRNLFHTVAQGAFFSTRAGRFLDFNEAMLTMLGYTDRDELFAIDLPSQLWPSAKERVAFQQVVEKQGRVVEYEARFRRRDQEIIDVLLTAQVLRNRQDEIIGYQGLVSDVTERRRVQAQLIRTEKMATLGTLSASVAHELNNPLGGIHIFAHLLAEKIPPEDPRRSYVDKIVRESTRCKDIIQDLLHFSRQSEPCFKPTDVNAVMSAVLDLLTAHALFQNIQLHLALDRSLPPVIGDASKLEQVFTNIIINAAEALEGKGVIDISTAMSSEGRFVNTRIADNGPGISDKVREHLFEPFVTTKADSTRQRGTGLGLAISYSIIVNHKGTIEVETAEKQGTAFTITLPAVHPR